METTSHQSFELIELLLNANSSTFRFVVIYRPPSSLMNNLTYPLFLEEFTSLLERIFLSSGKLMMVWGFNCHMDFEVDSNARTFLELLDIFNLKQHVNEPTHNNNHILDLIITRKEDAVIENVKILDAGISDHFVLHCNVDTTKPSNLKSEISYWRLGNIDINNFRQDILSSELYTKPVSTLAVCCDQYDVVLSTLLGSHAPLGKKTITIRPMAPWYNEDIKEQKTIQCKKERRWRTSGLQADRQGYIEHCTHVKNLIRKAKVEYYSSLDQEAGTDSRRLFQIINRFFHRKPEKLYRVCVSYEVGESICIFFQ